MPCCERRRRRPGLSAWRHILALFFTDDAARRRARTRSVLSSAGGTDESVHAFSPKRPLEGYGFPLFPEARVPFAGSCSSSCQLENEREIVCRHRLDGEKSEIVVCSESRELLHIANAPVGVGAP